MIKNVLNKSFDHAAAIEDLRNEVQAKPKQTEQAGPWNDEAARNYSSAKAVARIEKMMELLVKARVKEDPELLKEFDELKI